MKKIEAIIRTYQTLEVYKDKGHQVSTIKGKTKDLEVSHKIVFETRFERKGCFDLKYAKYNQQDKLELSGSLIKAGDGPETKSIIDFTGLGVTEQEMPLKSAILAHQGISQNVSYIIPSLLYGNELNSLAFYRDPENEVFECEVAGEPCIGIKIISRREVEIKPPDKEGLKDFFGSFSTKTSDKKQFVKDALQKLEESQSIFEYKKTEVRLRSVYYFRLQDNLLIKVEKNSEQDNLSSEMITYYQPNIGTLGTA